MKTKEYKVIKGDPQLVYEVFEGGKPVRRLNSRKNKYLMEREKEK